MKKPNYQDLIGKPYAAGAYGPEAYCCYGICWEVNRRLGRDLPRYEEICQGQAGDHIRAHRPEFRRVTDPRPGDLAQMWVPDPASGRPALSHIAVFISPGDLLQVRAEAKGGVHKMRLDHPWLAGGRIEGVYRYNGK